MNNKERKVYVVTGTTAPLKDGNTRDVTLVALLRTREVTLTPRYEDVQQIPVKDGIKTVKTIINLEREVVESVLSFGFAATSPLDRKRDADALKAYEDRGRTGKKPRIVITPENGIVVAAGKARKEKSALATLVTYDKFLTKGMIMEMLRTKLKHICARPDDFITVQPAKPSKEVKSEEQTSVKVGSQVFNTNKKAEAVTA